MWKSEQHILSPKYNILSSFVPLVKYYPVTYVDDDDKPFKIICKYCNGYLRCAKKSIELI